MPWTIRTWSGSVARDLNTITPDLREIISEVIGQPDWKAGNAMGVFFTHSGDGRTAGAFESGKVRAAALSVIYIDPAGLGESLASQSPEIERDPHGRYALRMRWPSFEIAGELGLSFQVEVSPDLARWTVVQPLEAEVTEVGTDGFGELVAEIDPQLLAGHKQFYFRVRVILNPPIP